MGLLDDFGKKVSDAGQKTLQKTKEMSEVVRINSLISQNESRLNNLYYQIGKLYVSVHGNEREEAFSEMIDSVAEMEQQISGYRKQIQDIKGVQRCEKCGAEVPIGVAFCSACGAAMPKMETTTNSDDLVQCPECGAKVEKGMRFCTTCGRTLNLSAVPASEITESFDPAEDMTAESSVKICPQCGTEITDDSVFCTVCGTKL